MPWGACRAALVLFVVVHPGCGENDGAPDAASADGRDGESDAASSGAQGDGLHRILVPLGGDDSDEIWIYAASPSVGDQLPVLVYGHGLNGEVVNCAPDAGSDLGSWGARALGSPAEVDRYAEAGYLAVGVLYRNKGDGAPGTGRLRLRDHYLRDARALLAAARWARDHHGRGSERIALIGSSMGTWPAFWAASDLPELADAQQGLDIRTIILYAETANHITNVSHRGCTPGESLIGAYWGLTFIGAAAPQHEISAADIRDGAVGQVVAQGFTELGVDALETLYFEPADPSIAGCAPLDGLPPTCSTDCLHNTGLVLWGGSIPPAVDRYRAPILEADAALCSLGPEARDPGLNTGNPFLDVMRATSPVYAATGLRTTRALPLLARGDSHYHQAGLARLTASLSALGASVPEPPIDYGPQCGHQDYFDESLPHCGRDRILVELEAAFATP